MQSWWVSVRSHADKVDTCWHRHRKKPAWMTSHRCVRHRPASTTEKRWRLIQNLAITVIWYRAPLGTKQPQCKHLNKRFNNNRQTILTSRIYMYNRRKGNAYQHTRESDLDNTSVCCCNLTCVLLWPKKPCLLTLAKLGNVAWWRQNDRDTDDIWQREHRRQCGDETRF